MLDVLKKICKESKYAAIYTNLEDSSKFIYGRVLAVNKDYIVISMISPNGTSDGILLKQTSDVVRVEINSKYHDKMQKLMSLYKTKSYEIDFDHDQFKEALLLFAQQKKQVVAIEVLNSDYDDSIGFVVQVKSDFCAIKSIDEYGYEDGIMYIKLNDITQISCSSQDENKILKLWEYNY